MKCINRQYSLIVALLMMVPVAAASAELLPTMEVQCPFSTHYNTSDVEVILTVQIEAECLYEILLFTPDGSEKIYENTNNTSSRRVHSMRVPKNSGVQFRATSAGGTSRFTYQVDVVGVKK